MTGVTKFPDDPAEPWRTVVDRHKPAWTTTTSEFYGEVFYTRPGSTGMASISQFVHSDTDDSGDVIAVSPPIIVLDDDKGGVIELSVEAARRLAEDILNLVRSTEPEAVVACSST